MPESKPHQIHRRDFLGGVATTAFMGSLLSTTMTGQALAAPVKADYPPTKHGMRGSHKGSFEAAHKLAWAGEKPNHFADTGEEYDLIVVGGGISGLAAACIFQQQHNNTAKVLVLDNHDDFGGHARRNEYHVDGQMLLGLGGTMNLDTPGDFSDDVNAFLAEIGIDLDALREAQKQDVNILNLDKPQGWFLNGDLYDEPVMLVHNAFDTFHGAENLDAYINALPVSEEERKTVARFLRGDDDLLPDMSPGEIWDYINATPYYTFLKDKAGFTDRCCRLFESLLKMNEGHQGDSMSVYTAMFSGAPAAQSMGMIGGLGSKAIDHLVQNFDALFLPDGNAGIARQMVRRLIPAVAPGHSMQDISTAHFDYDQLDRKNQPTRLRLNSTALHVHNADNGVIVDYVRRVGDTREQPERIRAKNAILACYNQIIPHICPEMPETQKEGLRYGEKVPMVYTTVLLKNARALEAIGPDSYYTPGSYFSAVTRVAEVDLEDYTTPRGGTDKPVLLYLSYAPTPLNTDDVTARDLFREGRHKVYRTSFEEYEAEIRKQLTAMFGPAGFDADQDILAITVNRWPHGYSYTYNSLYDPDFQDGEYPHEIGRQRFGKISIANSDSEASAYTHSAIDAAFRAVREIPT